MEGSISSHNGALSSRQVLEIIEKTLDDGKAEDIVTIDLRGKTDLADFMVVASGRSQRHVSTLAGHIQKALHDAHYEHAHAEGEQQGDWVLVDTIDVIVHIFRPEVREHYHLEKMWGAVMPERIPQGSSPASVYAY